MMHNTLRDINETSNAIKSVLSDVPEFAQSIIQYHKRGYIEFDPRWLMLVENGFEQREEFERCPEEFLKMVRVNASRAGLIEFGVEETAIDVVIVVSPERGGTDKRIQELQPNDNEEIVYIEGVVKGKTPVFGQVTSIRTECNSCGNIQPRLIREDEAMPDKITCRQCKGKCRVISKDIEPRFYVTLEETMTQSKNNDLSQVPVIFARGLAKPQLEERVTRGSHIRIAGRLMLKEKKGEKNSRLQAWVWVHGIAFLQEEGKDVVVTPEAKEKLDDIKSRMSLVQYWGEELYTAIQGERSAKESLIVQLVGNEQFKRGGKITRGDLHILFIGDPGSAKSTLLKLTQQYGLKTRYTSGKGASGVGITASVRKDETLGTWVVEAGAFPLAHRGLCIIDEIDKLDTDETDRLHEAMETQQLSIDRANVHVTLPSQTSLLAAGNPKEGSFDPNTDLFGQLDFPPAFLNRFDLLWVLIDTVDEVRDTSIARTIIENLNSTQKSTEPVQLFKQYLTLAKQMMVDTPPEISSLLTAWYQQMRKEMSKGNVKSRINARSIESLARLMTAHARAELRSTVSNDDYAWATKTFMESLRYVAMDPVTGLFDPERLQTGVSKSEVVLHKIIPDLIRASPQKQMDVDELQKQLENVSNKVLMETIKRLVERGDLYENPRGIYRILE